MKSTYGLAVQCVNNNESITECTDDGCVACIDAVTCTECGTGYNLHNHDCFGK